MKRLTCIQFVLSMSFLIGLAVSTVPSTQAQNL